MMTIAAMNTALRSALLALALCAGLQPASAERQGDPLAPLVDCAADANELEVLEKTRLPEHIVARRVETPSGPVRVSVADGWRLLLAARGSRKPVLNLKIERSQAPSFEADRGVLRAQMAYFVSRAPGELPLRDEVHGGVELLALRRPESVARGASGVAILMHAPTQVVASATFLDDQVHESALQRLLVCMALPLAER